VMVKAKLPLIASFEMILLIASHGRVSGCRGKKLLSLDLHENPIEA